MPAQAQTPYPRTGYNQQWADAPTASFKNYIEGADATTAYWAAKMTNKASGYMITQEEYLWWRA